MNLHRISDSVSLKAYKKLKELNPNNFYFVIANVIANAVDKNLDSVSGKILGNEYSFKNDTRTGEKIITIAGKSLKSNQTTATKVIGDLVKQLFDAEFNGLEISRPSGRTLLKDRTEFKDAEGTVFPSMYKKVKEGNALANLHANSADFLTVPQFEKLKKERKSFRANDYKLIGSEGHEVYVKKSSTVWDATDDFDNLKLTCAPKNIVSHADALYNSSDQAAKFYDDLEHNTTYCIIGDWVLEVTYTDGTISIKQIENNTGKIWQSLLNV